MADSNAPVDSTIDTPLDCLQELVITAPWDPAWTSVAARALSITELLEAIVIATTKETSYHSLSVKDTCWLFRLQKVNKTFARTIRGSLPLRKAMFRAYRPARTDRSSVLYRDTITSNPLFFQRYLISKFHSKPEFRDEGLVSFAPHLRFKDLKKFAKWAKATQHESWASSKATSSPCTIYVEDRPWTPYIRSSKLKIAGRFRMNDPTIGDIAMRIAQMYEVAYPGTKMWADQSSTVS
ncbi:hypothetical protein B0A48_01279 [Cryoendolithus antarcticus]|uniref:Uncharacterized protein n=1 Tax=Cryoendolithus antarcticus TaxID=1507870 RepID=A0A1V8TSS5_9PEZI|nr:hypothetical protein B0A48_01279 [Cryoendolithus antarcticus]